MQATAWVALIVLLTGCLSATPEPSEAPHWVGMSGGSSSAAKLTGEGEAEISGRIEAVAAQDVVAELYVDRECPETTSNADHLAQKTIELGDVEGVKSYSATLHFRAEPIFARHVGYAILRAANIDEPYGTMCIDFT